MALWLQRTAAQVAHNDPAEVKAARQQLSPVLPSRPLDILIIGSDRRVGQADLGARSDTLMVVRLDPQTNSISMLSVPRDLQVDIPGFGLNKINAAYSLGGARLAVETVKQVLGIPINDFIDVNFEGFIKVVDKLGGAYLMVDRRYYNNTAVTDYASIDLQPGYQRLNGHQTLSFVRFRHDQDGDFTRIVRQQMFLREMKRELAASATLTSFPHLLSVATIMSHYAVSDIAGIGRIFGLVTLGSKLDTNHIYQAHISGSTPTIGGVSYVVATPQEIAAGVRQFLNPVRPPGQTASATSVSQLSRSQVKVTVLNGSGQAGAAATVAAALKARGYAVAVGGNAPNFGYTTSTVAAGSAAATVAKGLGGLLTPAQVEINAETGAAADQITITVGSTFSGQLASAAAAAAAASAAATSSAASAASSQPIQGNTPQDVAQWRVLGRQTPLALFMPSAWSPGLGYDQFRAYKMTTDHGGVVPAAVVVGTTPQGGYWDVQAIRWTDPPILASPDTVRTIAGRSYSLYYDGANLRMVAWRVGGTAYWVSNTLDDELSNPLMLALATSCAPVGH